MRDCAVYADTLTHDPYVLAMLIETLGANRIAMGSDYPYPLGELDTIGGKGVYPGHMVEHLPSSSAGQDAAWTHFPWLPRSNADGTRVLPCLTDTQKQRMLSGTAKEWLGWK